jgi:ribosomal protein S4
MARHLDSVCQMCRREGIKLYLKGTRCESPKCAIERRDTPPGMHTRRGKSSEYGVRLREKQKLKRFYGLLERQFQRYFDVASRSKENTGEALLSVLERRLDNVVHRIGFAPSRASRQPVSWLPVGNGKSAISRASFRVAIHQSQERRRQCQAREAQPAKSSGRSRIPRTHRLESAGRTVDRLPRGATSIPGSRRTPNPRTVDYRICPEERG